MTIEEKYLELRKKSVDPKIIDTLYLACSPSLKTEQNLACIALFKGEIRHKMCRIFHEALPIWLTICSTLKDCVDLMESLRNIPESLKTVNSKLKSGFIRHFPQEQ